MVEAAPGTKNVLECTTQDFKYETGCLCLEQIISREQKKLILGQEIVIYLELSIPGTPHEIPKPARSDL